MADDRAYDALTRAVGVSQRTREVVDEVSSAAWHLTALPSRRDAARLLRRIATLNRKVLELERAVRRLELVVERRRKQG